MSKAMWSKVSSFAPSVGLWWNVNAKRVSRTDATLLHVKCHNEEVLPRFKEHSDFFFKNTDKRCLSWQASKHSGNVTIFYACQRCDCLVFLKSIFTITLMTAGNSNIHSLEHAPKVSVQKRFTSNSRT